MSFFKTYAEPEKKIVIQTNFPPSQYYVLIEDQPTPFHEFNFDSMSWVKKVVVPNETPENLDVNKITYGQADALMKASTVEELRSVMLEILGL